MAFMQLTLLVLLTSATANWANRTAVSILPTCPHDGLLPQKESLNVSSSTIPPTHLSMDLDDDPLSTALTLIQPERFPLESYCIHIFFTCLFFVVAVVFLEDDRRAHDFYDGFYPSNNLPLPKKVAWKGRVTLSIKSLKVEELDERLAIPHKERIQDTHLISANFVGSNKMAHPDLSFLYVHYRPLGAPKLPFVLFYNTDRKGQFCDFDKENADGLKWEFKIDTYDESSFSADQLAQGFYAMHKVYVHFLDADVSSSFVNPQKAIFKVQRGITSPSTSTTTPSSPTDGSFTPVAKKNSLPRIAFLKSLRKSVKTSLRDVASAFRKTPSKTVVDKKKPKAKGSCSAPFLNLNAASEC